MSDYLPRELVVEIFTRLPVKSLLRFRSLSKSWCSLISSSDFIRRHTLRLDKTTQKVLITNITWRKDIYTLHQEDQLPLSSGEGYLGIPAVGFPRAGFEIAGSCNGILCLCNISLSMYLWNFSVRRQLMIPRLPLRGRGSIGDVTVGFGFDPVTNDYKILTILYGDNIGDTLEVSLYSLNTASWSEIAPPATIFYHLRCDSCLVNETLYWVASESPAKPHCVIVTFDLSTHVFGTISLPKPNWKFKHLAPFNGSLALMCTKGDNIWIWVRTESNDVPTWSVFLKLESPQFKVGRILQPTSNGDLLIRTYPNCQTDQDVRVYNTRTGVLSTLLRFEAYCNIWMNTHVESLELLDRGTPCGETIKWIDRGTPFGEAIDWIE